MQIFLTIPFFENIDFYVKAMIERLILSFINTHWIISQKHEIAPAEVQQALETKADKKVPKVDSVKSEVTKVPKGTSKITPTPESTIKTPEKTKDTNDVTDSNKTPSVEVK